MRSEGCCFLSSLPLQTGLRRREHGLASQARFWLLISGLLLLEGTLFGSGPFCHQAFIHQHDL